MKTVTQYKEDIRVLMAKSASIDAQCVNENRDLTKEELIYKNEIMDTVKEYQDIIKTMERQERIAAELERPGTPQTQPKNENKGSGIKIRDKDKFGSLGEQVAAVIQASVKGGRVDPRLLNIRNAATGLGETVPSDGAFMIQSDFSNELLDGAVQISQLAQRCRTIEISSNSNSIKLNGVDESSRVSNLWGGIQVYMVDEGGTITASKPKFRRIELNLHKMAGICYLTEELMSDMVALEGWVRQGFESAFAFKMDDQIFQGTGAGECLGIMNGGGLVSVDKEDGQGATVIAENVINMYSRIFAESRSNAVWLINQNVEPQLFTMSISVGTGGVPVYMPAGGLSGQPYGTLFGRPVVPIQQCATMGTTGDIVLADLSNGYILARKGGMRQDVSIHVEFLTDQQILRFITRMDGQPVRATPLTPFKGGSDYTQGHFIALESR